MRSNNRLCGRCTAGAGYPEKSPMRAFGDHDFKGVKVRKIGLSFLFLFDVELHLEIADFHDVAVLEIVTLRNFLIVDLQILSR